MQGGAAAVWFWSGPWYGGLDSVPARSSAAAAAASAPAGSARLSLHSLRLPQPISALLLPWRRPKYQVYSHVGVGVVGNLPVLRRVLELHSSASEIVGCISLVYTADRGAAIRLLSPRGDLPLQLFPLRLYLLRGELHSSGVSENTDQPAEQSRFPRHLPRASLC